MQQTQKSGDKVEKHEKHWITLFGHVFKQQHIDKIKRDRVISHTHILRISQPT